eukprot:289930-Amphidinium_carterae.1
MGINCSIGSQSNLGQGEEIPNPPYLPLLLVIALTVRCNNNKGTCHRNNGMLTNNNAENATATKNNTELRPKALK